jgi:hypothetical protein
VRLKEITTPIAMDLMKVTCWPAVSMAIGMLMGLPIEKVMG